MKAIIAKKALEETEEEKKVPDPRGIKLTDIPSSITEEDLVEAIIEKFGPVERCFMPMEMGPYLKNRGFAIVNFKSADQASFAVQEGEITVNFAGVTIVKSFQQNRRDGGGRDGDRRDFDLLRRGPR